MLSEWFVKYKQIIRCAGNKPYIHYESIKGTSSQNESSLDHGGGKGEAVLQPLLTWKSSLTLKEGTNWTKTFGLGWEDPP